MAARALVHTATVAVPRAMATRAAPLAKVAHITVGVVAVALALWVLQPPQPTAAMAAMASKAHSQESRPITAAAVGVGLSPQAALWALAVKAVAVMLGRLVLAMYRVRARMARLTPAVAVAVTQTITDRTVVRGRLLAAVVVRGL